MDVGDDPEMMFPRICKRLRDAHSYGIFSKRYFGIDNGNPMNIDSSANVLLNISLVMVTIYIVRFLLKPFKQPKVVAEIIGGIFIGPSLLGSSKTFKDHALRDDTNFIVSNIGILAFMYFLFISGVKMDMTMLLKPSKRHVSIALIGVITPMITATIAGLMLRENMDMQLGKFSSIGEVSSSLAITALPVIYPILKELKLLSSDVGHTALYVAVIGDAIGMNAVIAFEAAIQAEGEANAGLLYLISLVGLGLFMILCLRQIMQWIVNRTPEGSNVSHAYISAILVGVLAIGFLTDMFGISIAIGPLWLGLLIPDGPPLGATLVEKCDTVIMEVLMPFAYAFLGLNTDFSAMSQAWLSLKPLLSMVLVGYASKLISTLAAALFFKMPIKDSLAFCLMLSLRGQVDYLLFMHWMDKKVIKQPAYTMMVLVATLMTALATPLIQILYDPTRLYKVKRRQTIQHSAPNSALGIVLCLYDQENVPSLFNLLELSNPSSSSPFLVHVLHLMELVGRASPILVDHRSKQDWIYHSSKFAYSSYQTIHRAMDHHRRSSIYSDHIQFHGCFTAMLAKNTMYQDICRLALTKRASLIILPFDKNDVWLQAIEGQLEDKDFKTFHGGMRSVNSSVFDNAPCSVAILVDKGQLRFRKSSTKKLHFAMLFLGGADAREALVYADRMAEHPDVASLTVLRFYSYNGEGDDEVEKKRDDGVVMSFRVKNGANEKVVYKDVVVRNGEDTVAAIRAINKAIPYDLWIVGRKLGIDPIAIRGMDVWGENHDDLGVVGDFISSADFGSGASVLVVQQQVLREE